MPPAGEYGGWAPTIMRLGTALTTEGLERAQALYQILLQSDKHLSRLMAPAEAPGSASAGDTTGDQAGQSGAPADCPPLPEEARIDPALGAGVCPWLDRYIAWSRQESGKAFDGFHKACGLALLSAIAGTRVYIPLSTGDYPMLYIGLVAPSGQYAKTFTIKKALKVLHAAGLGYLLLPDDCTPEKMVNLMADKTVPEDYFQLGDEKQVEVQRRLAFANQKLWHYDEFGQKLDAMGRESGPMADFSGMLRRMYDGQDSYSRATIGRGLEEVNNPYLSMLAGWTPNDMKRNPKTGAALWLNGFWGRWAPVYPTTPPVRKYKRAWRKEVFSVPAELTTPLVQWHLRLGIPDVTIERVEDEKSKKPTGQIRAEIARPDPHVCDTEAIQEAFECYQEALEDLVPNVPELLASNYERFATMALHIAALLASLDNGGKIEMRHWAYAQQAAEEWRASLHMLYEHVNQAEPSRAKQEEERILYWVRKLGGVTPAEINRRVKIGTGEARSLLQALEANKVLVKAEKGRCKEWYVEAAQEEKATG